MQGDTEKELVDYGAVLEMEDAPGEQKARAQNAMGVGYDQLGQHEQALFHLEQAIQLAPDEPVYIFNQIESLFKLGRWQEGWLALKKILKRLPPGRTGKTGDIAALINIIASSSSALETWTDRIRKRVSIYKEAKVLSFLGKGLVQSLASTRSIEAFLEPWSQAWESVCGHETELRIPLRIFTVGVQYLKTHNPQVLYDLAMEERSILQEVLDIELK